MKVLQCILLLALVLHEVVGPPVDPKKKHPSVKKEDGTPAEDDTEPEMGLEYSRYLKEVIQALESDEAFRKKLEAADVNDIKSGKISKELEFVSHYVRTTLDELKRAELERLRHLAIQEYEKNRGVDKKKLKIPAHLDHRNLQTFEIEDLRKLIVQTTKDLEEVDRKRKEEFKTYELEKEFERREKLKEMDEEKKVKAQEEYDQAIKKHKDHPKLHHPGSKQQLEEVWEEKDHMRAEDFEPKTFFYMHDLDGNNMWDQDEVKALFQKELDKLYDPNAPEDDMSERVEEMERMREHVFNESDTNKDGLISFEEFLVQTQKEEFEKDPGWQSLDEQPMYSEQEFQEFERRRQEEIHRMMQMQPPHPGMVPHPGVGVPPQGYYPSQGYHPQAVPVQPHGYHPQGVPMQPQGYHPQEYHPQGVPVQPQAYHPQGVPVRPQGYYQQGVPVQPQGYHPQGVPVQPQGYHPQAVPVQQQGHHAAQVVPVQTQVDSHQPQRQQPQARPVQGQAVPGQPQRQPQAVPGQPQRQPQGVPGQPQRQQQGVPGQPQRQQQGMPGQPQEVPGQPQRQLQEVPGQLQRQQPQEVHGQPQRQQPQAVPVQTQGAGKQPDAEADQHKLVETNHIPVGQLTDHQPVETNRISQGQPAGQQQIPAEHLSQKHHEISNEIPQDHDKVRQQQKP